MAIPGYTDYRFRLAAGNSWHPGGLSLTRHGLELCRFPKGSAVLDIGCGTGETLKLLRSLSINAIGLDTINHAHGDLPVTVGDASSPPFGDRSFDGIVCECVLSLLPSPEEAVLSFGRILKSGGRLMLSDVYVQENDISAFPRLPSSSCLQGALPRSKTELFLNKAGLRLVLFEDHPEELKELAAKLIWYGGISLEDACIRSASGRRWGYGLWIAEKASVPDC